MRELFNEYAAALIAIAIGILAIFLFCEAFISPDSALCDMLEKAMESFM